MFIGAYETETQFVTTGSGNARWCVAHKDGKQFFLKQFLAPVQPVQTTDVPTEQVLLRRERCAAFEQRKLAMYRQLKNVHGDCVVRMTDFFVFDGHYFTASEYIDPSHQTFETIRKTAPRMMPMLVFSLAECLRMLHSCGIVHADLKPEHIIVKNEWGRPRVSMIDFDSGFLEASPPDQKSNLEVDPAYLSPEGYLLITGNDVKLTRKLDTFAFGILLHQALTGTFPAFDTRKYTYLYACVLDGGKIKLSPGLDGPQSALIQRMLRKNPAKRPDDPDVCMVLRNYI